VTPVDSFRAEARSWLAANVASAPPDWGAIMPAERRDQGLEWQRRLHSAGFAGIHWPVEHGGRGLGPQHQQVWLEECAEAGVPPFLNMVGLVLAGGAIQLFGTEQQKQSHLPPTVRGERVWCQLFSEPGAGSDLASLSTRAEQDGDGWVVNGQKVWCSGGRASDWGILLARTEPVPGHDDVPRHAGISFFLLDMRSEGVEARPLRQMTGDADFDEVFLTDVRVPSDGLLGERGQGWTIAMATLTDERGHIGSLGRSITRRLDDAISLATSGGPRPDAVAVDRICQLLVTGRAYLAMAGRQGPDAGAASSLGKLGMTGFGFDLAELRVDTAGASGMLSGPECEGLVAAPGGWFGGGTSQIQRNIIGERVLGLPREPRPDRRPDRRPD
jgi:alkylation response protein AidB-like acyl-CoA dehydrogenase